MWLARSETRVGYKVYYRKPNARKELDGREFYLDARNPKQADDEFERNFPHLKLKPGEGPVEVEVTIRRVKK